MQYSTNLHMNKPELNEQYRLSHWNDNTDILDTQIQNIKDLNDNTLKTSLLNFCYPVGSLYWSSKSTDPSTLFGGTWTPIKDCFVWAKGDNDTVNATGGEKTHTLTVSEIPSHNHSFTPAGSISVTTNPTFTGSEHSHTYTPAGSISVTTNPTFTGSAVTSGANNRGHTHSVGAHSHTINSGNTSSSGTATTAGIRHSGSTGGMSANATGSLKLYESSSMPTTKGNISTSTSAFVRTDTGGGLDFFNDSNSTHGITLNVAHTHTLPASYIYGKTDNSTAFNSGDESQNHTHSVTASGTISGGAYKFTGTQATLKATAGGSISGGAYKFTGSAGTTGSKGDGNAHNNMPPYIVKYCWERTA